jgi:hypothetical protein
MKISVSRIKKKGDKKKPALPVAATVAAAGIGVGVVVAAVACSGDDVDALLTDFKKKF